MKKFRTDEEWHHQLDSELQATEALLQDSFHEDVVADSCVFQQTLKGLLDAEARRQARRTRMANVLGTSFLVTGAFGCLAIFAFVLIQIGQRPNLAVLGLPIHSRDDLLLAIGGSSVFSLVCAGIGYGFLRRNEYRTKRLKGVSRLLGFGVAATIFGAVVDFTQGWFPLTMNPGFIAALYVTFGGIIFESTNAIARVVKRFSVIAFVLLALIACSFALLTYELMSHKNSSRLSWVHLWSASYQGVVRPLTHSYDSTLFVRCVKS
jgi:hypothetical protein